MEMFSNKDISQKSGYKFLWYLLSIFGIEIFESEYRGAAGKLKLILKTIFPFSLFAIIIYLAIAHFAYGCQWQILMSYMVIGILALVLWYKMHRNRLVMQGVVIHLSEFDHRLKKYAKKRSAVVNLCLAFAIIIPSTIAVLLLVYIRTAPEFAKKYYSFLIQFQNDNSPKAIFIRSINLQVAIALEFTYPAVVAVTCGTIYHMCSDLFSEFYEDISVYQHRLPRRHEMFQLLQKQKMLYRLALDVEECLSATTSLNISMQILKMYTALATILITDTKHLTSFAIYKMVPALTLTPATVIGVILCASRISSRIEKICTKFKLIHNELISYDKTDWELVELTRIMMKTSFPKMTACGVVELTPGLILSVFGCLLTYGLLVTNLK